MVVSAVREKKRQRTAALQNLADGIARRRTRQRLGVRLSSAAFLAAEMLGGTAFTMTHQLVGFQMYLPL